MEGWVCLPLYENTEWKGGSSYLYSRTLNGRVVLLSYIMRTLNGRVDLLISIMSTLNGRVNLLTSMRTLNGIGRVDLLTAIRVH